MSKIIKTYIPSLSIAFTFIVIYSLIYILAMITIHFYSYYISKQQADEINKILGKKRENSNG